MSKHSVSVTEIILLSHLIGGVGLLIFCLFSGDLAAGLAITKPHMAEIMSPVLLFSFTGFYGLSFVLILIRIYGAFVAVTVTNLRKLLTLSMSFFIFPKPFHMQYVWGGLMVVVGIYLAGKKTSARLPTTVIKSSIF